VGGHRLVLFQIVRPGRERNFHDHFTGRRFPFPVATTSARAGFLDARWQLVGSERLARLSEIVAEIRS
jgi:hypothetical protein